MEEVDKIIMQSLHSIGCEIGQDVETISQFDQDMFIESVSKLLNILNTSGGEQATLPKKLPPNTAVKFRICANFATICQTLGYRGEIGYQTFLYSNETEMRRLLIFLVEKLNKEMSASSATKSADDGKTQNQAKQQIKLKLSTDELLARRVAKSLGEIWLPPYCKPNGLRLQSDNSYVIEGSKFYNGFKTFALSTPSDYANADGEYTKEANHYCQSYCNYPSQQGQRHGLDALASLMHRNTVALCEEQWQQQQQRHNTSQKRREGKANVASELKSALKAAWKRAEKENLGGRAAIGQQNASSLVTKNSRFTLAESFQFTKESDASGSSSRDLVMIGAAAAAAAAAGENESNRPLKTAEEEIDKLKLTLDELSGKNEQSELSLRSLAAAIERMEQECVEQTELNKQLDERLKLKKKAAQLLDDTTANIGRLREEIDNHDKRMHNLKSQWETHRQPMIAERDAAVAAIEQQRQLMLVKMDELKDMRVQVEELEGELALKDQQVVDLTHIIETEQQASLASSSSSGKKKSTRAFYTKRILEIVANIDKQKREIEKILAETRTLQKEINQLSGKLSRVFNANDELLFRDAKRDEVAKRSYKLFVSINEAYDKLIESLETASQLERQIFDLEDQCATEKQNKVTENMQQVLVDLRQVKDENDKLMAKIKGSSRKNTNA